MTMWDYDPTEVKKKNKYKNNKIEVDGILFDSKKEADHYSALKLLERIGEISDLQLQVPFVLIPEQREPDSVGPRGGVTKGKVIEREITYIADFVYKKDGKVVVTDTKGFRTPDYIMKRKMMLYFHGIKIKEI